MSRVCEGSQGIVWPNYKPMCLLEAGVAMVAPIFAQVQNSRSRLRPDSCFQDMSITPKSFGWNSLNGCKGVP